MKQRYLFFCLLLLPVLAFAYPENRPLEFVANKGQWSEPILFQAHTGNSNIFLESNCFTFVVGSPDNIPKIQSLKNGTASFPMTIKLHAYKMKFEGANTPIVEGNKPQQYYYNYYLGNDPTRWKSGIHPNLSVDYKELYPNVDLHISSENSRLKYDFIIKPGADISKIKLTYEGPDKLEIKNGNLQIQTSVGTIEELAPYAYQYKDGERIAVRCKYKLTGNTVSYYFPDDYDHNQSLIIDPTVVFATFTGSSYDNWGYTATYDLHGNFYAGGITTDYLAPGYQFKVTNPSYPITTGAIQINYAGGNFTNGLPYPSDMAITKFDSAGKNIIYSTYLGGSDNEQPHSLIVDAGGNLIIAGRSYSTNFPVTAGCYDNSQNGGADLVIVKFNATGTALIGSTFIGGSSDDIVNGPSGEFNWGDLKHNYGDDARSEVIVDKSGNIYVAASTKSTNFPTTGTAIKTTINPAVDTQDAIVLKMNPNLTSMIWSTYLGGSSADAAYVLTLDTSETQLYVAGGTKSNNFPTTSGVWHSSYMGGSCDGFLCRFQNGGTYALQKASYIGANDYDQVYGVQMDYDNNVYVMGQTLGGNYQVTSGVYTQSGSSQFVTKLDHDFTAPIASTVFGSGTSTATNISPVAFLVDTCENVYISGWGGNLFGSNPPTGTGNTNGMPVSGNATQATTDGQDFYFIVFSKNLIALQYASFMGTNGGVGEHVDGGTSRFDKNGVVYQAICGGCSNGTFPTGPVGVVSLTNGSWNCNLVALKIAFNFGAVKTHAAASPNKTICLGDPVNFSSAGTANATSYEWDFGDGSPTNFSSNPIYTYAKAGTFQVRLIGINPNACKVRDTAYLTIKVDTNTIRPDFTVQVLDSCLNYTISLTNNSKYGNPASGTSFYWDFGDGKGTSTLPNPGTYSYTNKGTYTIKLIESDPNACNSPDSVSKTVSFNSFFVKAGFQFSDVCQGDTSYFANTSGDAATYKWLIGDSTFTTASAKYKFDSAGTYKVKLYAYNPASCNKVDSAEHTITVNPSPVADFTVTYDHPIREVNDSVHFTNKSRNADTYNWDFGDKYGSQETSPVHFYKRTGLYTVCLQSSNKFGCTDTNCKQVAADVLPLADIPTGFSPNGDGNNDVLYVRGAAIESMNLKIFNRWGQMVFESNNQKDGWDGTYKGRPQEMDAYGYVLNVVFLDETTFHKQGNVTLLR